MQLIRSGRQLDAEVYGFPYAEALLRLPEVVTLTEHFGELLGNEDLLWLYEDLLQRAAITNYYTTEARLSGFIPLWRMIKRRGIELTDDWVLTSVKQALPTSLRLAYDLSYYHRKRQDDSLRTGIQAKIVAEARRFYTGRPDVLQNALSDTWPWELDHFIGLCGHSNNGSEGGRAHDWSWLAHVMLDIGTMCPEKVVPHLSILIVHKKSPVGRDKAPFRVKPIMARKLFGTRFEELVRLLAKDHALPNAPAEALAYVQYARQAAAAWLARSAVHQVQ